ncbi:MAG: alpha/beta hydrolase fold domain-containing protein [Thermoleophilaceae bacterium]
MNTPLPEHTTERAAELHLRGPLGPLPVRLLWPPAASAAPAITLLCPGGDGADALALTLCGEAGVLVVRAREGAGALHLASAVEWLADRGAELGGDPGRLLVAGVGAGGALAAALALEARDRGWPPLARQLLVLPELGAWARPLAGVAPATVVSPPGDSPAHRYADALRAGGVEVDELRGDLRRLSELATSLRGGA